MENENSEKYDTNQSVPLRAKRPGARRFYLVLMVSAIVILLIVAIIAIPGQSIFNQRGQQILNEGDHLRYDVSGCSNNTAITPVYYNVTIHHPTEDFVAYEMYLFKTTPSSENDIIPPNLGHEFKPYWSKADLYGRIVDIENISTSFGMKSVKVLSFVDNGYNETDKVYFGSASSIVYRWSVSASSGAYQYTYELTSTNNVLISSADPS